MKITFNSQNFKGYDAAPLKKIYIQKESASQVRDDLALACKQENIEIEEILHSFKWMQDHQVILSKKSAPCLLADKTIEQQGIEAFEKNGLVVKKSRNYIAGGNSYIGKYPNGEKWMLIGSNEMFFHRKKTISREYDIKKENIFFIPQPDFHIDMGIRPIGYPNILVNDYSLCEDFINEFSDGSVLFEEFSKNVCQKMRVQGRHYAYFDDIKKALIKAGFNVVPIAGIFGHNINFMNAIVNQHPDGTISYITNSSLCGNKYCDEAQKFFESQLREKVPNLKKVYFIQGEENTEDKSQNRMMYILANQQGGIHCLSLEEVDFNAWLESK